MIRETVAHKIERAKSAPINRLEFVDDSFMTVNQIAEKFAICDETVRAAQNRGELAYCVFGDPLGTRQVRRSPFRAVIAWAEKRLIIRESVA